MATKVASLYAEIGADTSGLKKGLNEADRGVKDFSGALGGLGTMMAGVSFAALAKGAIDFGIASINAASDVEEMSSKFSVVFGPSAEEATQKLDEFADAANRSVYDLMGFAASIQDTFVPLGMARDEAADLSVEVVKLAEDLGSFNNLNSADVMRDIQSALVGNFETMRKYGVVLNEATVKEQAFSMGLYDGTGNIDAQSKALAALEIIYGSTADAQGDAIETADSYANTTRGLEGAFKKLQVTIGNLVLKEGSGFLGWLTDVTNAVNDSIIAQQTYNETLREYKDMVEEGTLKEDNRFRVTTNMGRANRSAAAVQEQMNDAIEEANMAMKESIPTLERVRDGHRGYADAMRDAADASDILGDSTIDFGDQLDELESFISGSLGSSIEEYNQQQQDVSAEMREIQKEIDGLISKGTNLTDSEKAQIGELQGRYAELASQYDANAAAHEEATKRILFDLMAQRAAMDGLSSAEYTLLLTMAEGWGLIDEATRDAALGFDEVLGTLAPDGSNMSEAIRGVDTLLARLMGVEGVYDVTFNISVIGDDYSGLPATSSNNVFVPPGTYDAEWASGVDSFVVPSGYPNDSFSAGLTSGEVVSVSKPGETPSGGGDTYNITMSIGGGSDGYEVYQQFRQALDNDLRAKQNAGVRASDY